LENHSVGSAAQWVQVVIAALFYGGGMLFMEARERKANRKPVVVSSQLAEPEKEIRLKSILPSSLVLIWLVIGWAFGVAVVFPLRQAFSWPLLAVMLGPFLAMCSFAFAVRKLQSSRFANRSASK
jgi:hypothetical protein